MRSKYLNQVFDGWKVISAVRTKGSHKSFILAKKMGEKIVFMTLRDSQLSKLSSLKTTMSQLIAGKAYQLSKNIRFIQNTVVTL